MCPDFRARSQLLFVLRGSARGREERRFKVLVKIAARVDLYRLDEYMAGRLPEAPQEALQALDIVLREQATIRCAGRARVSL